jgi:hypothetical protein
VRHSGYPLHTCTVTHSSVIRDPAPSVVRSVRQHAFCFSRIGVHDRGYSPPSSPRLRRSARWHLVMAHNDRVRDVSAIQTPPPIEIQLIAPVQKVHKMIADHPALASLASHGCFLLIGYPCRVSKGHHRHYSKKVCIALLLARTLGIVCTNLEGGYKGGTKKDE